jgi:hypothetical protein
MPSDASPLGAYDTVSLPSPLPERRGGAIADRHRAKPTPLTECSVRSIDPAPVIEGSLPYREAALSLS